MSEVNFVGRVNRSGARCTAHYGHTCECVCACGEPFNVVPGAFWRVSGCPKCREDRRGSQRGYYKGRSSGDRDQMSVLELEPAAMWRRICERHRSGESDIGEIAARRRPE